MPHSWSMGCDHSKSSLPLPVRKGNSSPLIGNQKNKLWHIKNAKKATFWELLEGYDQSCQLLGARFASLAGGFRCCRAPRSKVAEDFLGQSGGKASALGGSDKRIEKVVVVLNVLWSVKLFRFLSKCFCHRFLLLVWFIVFFLPQHVWIALIWEGNRKRVFG